MVDGFEYRRVPLIGGGSDNLISKVILGMMGVGHLADEEAIDES